MSTSTPHYDWLQIEKGMVVFDIGAHIGSFTLKAAKNVGVEGKVVALESEPENYRILKENIGLNEFKNVLALNNALSGFKGKGKLYLAQSTMAHTLIFDRGIESREVETTTLDGLIEKLEIYPDAMKIDAEGASLKILSVAKRLAECRQIVVAAYHFHL